MFVVICVLKYMCCNMCIAISVLEYACWNMCVGICVLEYVVAVAVVVVGHTVGSISSETLAYHCLFTLELCLASMIATSKLGHSGIFCPAFVQA